MGQSPLQQSSADLKPGFGAVVHLFHYLALDSSSSYNTRTLSKENAFILIDRLHPLFDVTDIQMYVLKNKVGEKPRALASHDKFLLDQCIARITHAIGVLSRAPCTLATCHVDFQARAVSLSAKNNWGTKVGDKRDFSEVPTWEGLFVTAAVPG